MTKNKYILTTLSILFTAGLILTAPKARAEVRFVLEDFDIEKTTGSGALTYVNGRYYTRETSAKMTYYAGYYVVGAQPAALLDVICSYRVNGANYSATVDSYNQEQYGTEDAVLVFCVNGGTFNLNEGANTIEMGANVVFQGGITYGARYDTITVYRDTTVPAAGLSLKNVPSSCTTSKLPARDADCKVTVEYMTGDFAPGRMFKATLKVTASGAGSKTYTLPSSTYDGNYHPYSVDLYDLGITASGAYSLDFTLTAEDEAGNTETATLNVPVTVTDDTPPAGGTTTPTPTSTPTTGGTTPTTTTTNTSTSTTQTGTTTPATTQAPQTGTPAATTPAATQAPAKKGGLAGLFGRKDKDDRKYDRDNRYEEDTPEWKTALKYAVPAAVAGAAAFAGWNYYKTGSVLGALAKKTGETKATEAAAKGADKKE